MIITKEINKIWLKRFYLPIDHTEKCHIVQSVNQRNQTIPLNIILYS